MVAVTRSKSNTNGNTSKPADAAATELKFNVNRIAVIGAGPAGLAAAKYLAGQKKAAYRNHIDVFEQSSEVGGVWDYNSVSAGVQQDSSKNGSPTASASSSWITKIPQTDAHLPVEEPVYIPAAAGDDAAVKAVFPTSMYENMHTNVPKSMMGFSDLEFPQHIPLFPPRSEVQNYLVRYAEEIRHLIQFETQVVDVKLLRSSETGRGDDDKWDVTTKSLSIGRGGGKEEEEEETKTKTKTYDAVVVASGHYAVPYIPDIPGLSAFAASNPGVIRHAKWYRNPKAEYQGKRKVVVVGNAASGLDITAQIAGEVVGIEGPRDDGGVKGGRVIVSARTPTAAGFKELYGKWREEVGEIVEVLEDDDDDEEGGKGKKGTATLRFSDGKVESGIDAVLFCTGYLYSYPFLRGSLDDDKAAASPPLVTTGRRVHGLAKQLIHVRHPTLVFPALPMKVLPFPLAEAQAAVFARLWANELPPPPPSSPEEEEEEKKNGTSEGDHKHHHNHQPAVPTPALIITKDLLKKWESQEEAESREEAGGRPFHVFPGGGDGKYINEMYCWAMGRSRSSSDVVEAHGHGGRRKEEEEASGKEPPYWGPKERWVRSIIPHAKMRFEDKGMEARTLEELGFRWLRDRDGDGEGRGVVENDGFER